MTYKTEHIDQIKLTYEVEFKIYLNGTNQTQIIFVNYKEKRIVRVLKMVC